MSSYSNQQLATELQGMLAPLEMVPLDQELVNEQSVGKLRRSRRLREADTVGVVTLLDIDGVLIWEDGAVTASTSATRRRRGGALVADGEVVTQLKFSKELGVNEIAEKLAQLDQRLTPQGPAQLLVWDKKTWQPTPAPATPLPGKSALVLIHGTFSSSGNLMAELKATTEGQAFLVKASATYDQVLSYDHFTLSRSPFLNALELDRALAAHPFERVDVVCHSRGGLVTRWWLEVINRRVFLDQKVILVGCPLRGTSLADPQSVRNGLNLLTNIGKLLGQTCQLVPMLTAAGGLMRIFSSVAGAAAKVPVVDAAIAMVPGLAAMSRTRTSFELNALNWGNPVMRPGYSAVLSDFQPHEVGWRFWRLFNADQAKNAAADYLVFNQANDLVVDTESMTHHAFGPNPEWGDAKRFLYFEKSPNVFHTNYFQNPEVLKFLAERLEI